MALNLKVFSVNYKLCATNYKVNRASHNGRNIHATVLFSGSWFVNACHYTRTGCGEITLAGSPRASPYVRPLGVFLATGHLRPAFIFSSPVCDSVGAAQIFRVCQLQDSSLDRQWLRAARYALRVSRSVVVSLSLSRRSRI